VTGHEIGGIGFQFEVDGGEMGEAPGGSVVMVQFTQRRDAREAGVDLPARGFQLRLRRAFAGKVRLEDLDGAEVETPPSVEPAADSIVTERYESRVSSLASMISTGTPAASESF
jgi:hypothetical protein